jgi:transcriptional regulator with XRE-family HTH domain
MSNTSKTIKINGERVKAFRTKRGLSQKGLAGSLKVDVGTVSRWERGEIDHVRRDIFGKLCMLLNATEAEICGDEPLSESSASQRAASRGQMNLSISTACRNALSLVAMRYRVTRQQIVEAAPLLLVVVAESSLQHRQKRLDKFRDAEDKVQEALTSGPDHLPLYSPVDEWEESLRVEERSINARDLFGTEVRNPGQGNDAEDNPFATFLTALLARLDPPAKTVSWRHDSAP